MQGDIVELLQEASQIQLLESLEMLEFKEIDDNTKDIAEVVYVDDALLSAVTHCMIPEPTQCFAVTAKKEKFPKNKGKLNKKIQEIAYYLPQKDQSATVMFIGHYKKKDPRIFVTSPLTGCDVWIGQCKDVEPALFVVHIKSSEDVAVDNLKEKERLAVDTATKLGKKKDTTCTLLHRIAFDSKTYHKGEENAEEKIGPWAQYWNSFNKKYTTPVYLYSGPSFFFMVYNEDKNYWRLKLRDIRKNQFILP